MTSISEMKLEQPFQDLKKASAGPLRKAPEEWTLINLVLEPPKDLENRTKICPSIARQSWNSLHSPEMQRQAWICLSDQPSWIWRHQWWRRIHKITKDIGIIPEKRFGLESFLRDSKMRVRVKIDLSTKGTTEAQRVCVCVCE